MKMLSPVVFLLCGAAVQAQQLPAQKKETFLPAVKSGVPTPVSHDFQQGIPQTPSAKGTAAKKAVPAAPVPPAVKLLLLPLKPSESSPAPLKKKPAKS